ncbi:hypothetical protein K3495_g6116 [Podosphaera aphanis]|nr:hypothetical protein K3495_g6116 [Podosphaera aphanis]
MSRPWCTRKNAIFISVSGRPVSSSGNKDFGSIHRRFKTAMPRPLPSSPSDIQNRWPTPKQHEVARLHYITVFEDNMADSLYSNKDKSHWRDMLERRLSVPLGKLLSASDVPSEYHKFVAYLRIKDAGLQEIKATSSYPEPYRPPMMSHLMLNSTALPNITPTPREPTVSQGGSAMDLDVVSRQKGPDGKLAQAAKEARRALGRCVWCNRSGHVVSNCPLGSRSIVSIITADHPTTEALKEPLQQSVACWSLFR